MLRERHRPSAGGRLDAGVDRERVHEVRVVAGDDEEPAGAGVDHRRPPDAVPAGRTGAPSTREARWTRRTPTTFGFAPRAGNAKKRPAPAARAVALHPVAPDGQPACAGPVLKVEDRRRSLVRSCCRSSGTSRWRRRSCQAHLRDGRDREARLGEGRAAEDVVASLKDRLRAGVGVAPGARARSARILPIRSTRRFRPRRRPRSPIRCCPPTPRTRCPSRPPSRW